MTELINFWYHHGLELIEAGGCLIGLILGLVALLTKKGGKDIDGDGKPDLPKKFNTYFTIIEGKRIYLKDLNFYKEEEK